VLNHPYQPVIQTPNVYIRIHISYTHFLYTFRIHISYTHFVYTFRIHISYTHFLYTFHAV
jgi:hypothetical protein